MDRGTVWHRFEWKMLRGWAALLLLGLLLVAPAGWANIHIFPHRHEFGSQESNLPQPSVSFAQTSARPGQVVELNSYSMGMDIDYCTNRDHEDDPVWETEFDTFYYLQCNAPNREFYDSVQVGYTAVNGELGTRDAFGQFQPLAAGQFPTHFRCGNPGMGSVSASADDLGQGYDPGSGNPISLYNDTPNDGSVGVATITIATHQHAWTAVSNLPTPTLTVSSYVSAGERIPVAVSVESDYDDCTADNCPFYYGYATNEVRASAWAGGTFGYYESSGQWTPTTNPALITHWQAPVEPGEYTLRVDVDDVPTATDQDGNPSATYDDQSSFATATVYVYDPNPHHAHSFGDPADPPLDPPSLTFERSTARPGRVVALSTYFSQMDADRCKNEDGACPWWAATVYDVVHASFSATGGDLGTLDGAGQFQPLTPGQTPTHFRCGPTLGTASVTVTLDDAAQVNDPINGELIDTYDDASVSRTATLQIAEHQHQWDGDNLMPGSVSGDPYPQTGSLVWLSWTDGSDWDYCGTEDCPFGDMASNPVRRVSWSGPGQFGYLDAGQFVPTSDAALVTCWKAPDTPGDATLTVTWDDLPEAMNPETGAIEATKDDAPAASELVLHVQAPPSHEHSWQVGSPLSAPYVQVTNVATPGALLPVSVGGLMPDQDQCSVSECSFSYGYAYNNVVLSRWSDAAAGGAFGYIAGSTFVPTDDASLVTHYRCPNDSGMDQYVTLTAIVDDQWQGIPDPATGELTDTFDDGPASGSAVIQVMTNRHQHQWTHNGNTAWQTTTLYRNGAATRAVYQGEVLEVRLGEIHPDEDYCTAQGCPFPGGHAIEAVDYHRTVRLDSDCGGIYGTLAGGEFTPLDPTDIEHITHFQVPLHTASSIHLFSWIDDAGLASPSAAAGAPFGAGMGDLEPTDDEEAAPAGNNTGGRVCITVGDGPFTNRAVSGDDGCGCPNCNSVPALSAIDPQSGAVSFEVPVTGWTYRGSQLGLTLHYNSNSKADPRLEGAAMPNVQAQPNRAGLSRRNTRWTHSWAQFVEVVSDGAEVHALWHTGNGGSVGFLGIWDTATKAYTWAPTDSVHSMESLGTASHTYQTQVVDSTANVLVNTTMRVDVPYGQFRVTDGAGTLYTFSQVHWETGTGAAIPYFLLRQVRDRWNRTVTVNWNGDGLPTSVTDGDLRGLTFSYQDRLLRSVTDPQGKTHTFSYTDVSSGLGDPMLPPPPTYPKLTGVTVRGPGSPNRVDYQWAFDYGTPADKDTYYGGSYTGDLVIRKTEPSGKYVHYAYAGVNTGRGNFSDWDGRVVRSWYVDGTEGSRVKEYRLLGNTLIFPGGDQTTYSFQGHDLVTVHDDVRNREVGYTYDGYHNLTGVSLNGTPQATIAYTYAADNRTIVKARATNALGDVTETEFTTWGRPIRSTAFRRPTGGQPYDLKTTWLYNNTGPGDLYMATIDGAPRQYHTIFSYNASTAPGAPSAVEDYLGRVWTTEYDSLGRPSVSRTPPNPLASTGNPDQNPSVSTLQYNADGLPSLVTDPLGRQVQVTYNGIGAGLLEVTTSQVGVANSTRKLVVDRGGRVVKVTDANGVETQLTYNGDGQVLSVLAASNGSTPHLTRYEYDLHGNLTALIPPKGAAGTVRFEYVRCDPQGVPDPNGVYEGQVTRIIHPDWNAARGLGQEIFGYDPATGLLAWTSRPYSSGGSTLFAQTTFYRDALFRVTQVNYPTSPQGIAGFSTGATYDEFGRVQSVIDPSGTTTYTYDAVGRVRRIKPSGSRRELTISYFEDPTLKRVTTSASLWGVSGYWESREDPKGRLSGIVNPFGQTFSYEYDAAGQPLWQYNANNTQTRYQYDPRGRLSRLTHINSGGGILDDFSYSYDPEGRLLQELDSSFKQHNFAYDDFGQLIREEHPDLPGGVTRYFYDANGNRTDVQRGSQHEYYRVDAADKLLWTNTAGNTAPTANQAAPYSLFTYDDFGQLTRRDRKDASGRRVHDFRWDGDGRLREVKEGGSQHFWADYTADGERYRNSDIGGSHLYSFGLYDDANGGAYTYTPGLAVRRNGVDRFFHSDWLGSTRALTDGSGGVDPVSGGASVPYRKRFDAYGLQSAFAGTDSPDAVVQQYAGAWGYQRDAAELGLDYLYQRYYDPALGRFITRDPIRWAGGLNLYSYTGNNPVNFADPTGLSPSEGRGEYWVSRAINALRPLARLERGILSIAEAGRPPGQLSGVLTMFEGLHDAWATWGCEEGLNDGGHGDGFRLWTSRISAGAQTVGVATSIVSVGPTLRALGEAVSSWCFPGDTVVRTRDGNKPISEIQVGEEVLSYDQETGKSCYRKVIRTFKRQADRLVQIVSNDGQSIQATPEHPFWVDGKGFVPARNVIAGDNLSATEGCRNTVAGVFSWQVEATVYNLEVDGTHTYYANGWLVHNACVFYHGASEASIRALYAGAPLDAEVAASLKTDGPPGFFLATDSAAAEYFAARAEGAILEYSIEKSAVSALRRAGAILRDIPYGGGAYLPGKELHIPPKAFGVFNELRAAGQIKVTPFNPFAPR